MGCTTSSATTLEDRTIVIQPNEESATSRGYVTGEVETREVGISQSLRSVSSSCARCETFPLKVAVLEVRGLEDGVLPACKVDIPSKKGKCVCTGQAELQHGEVAWNADLVVDWYVPGDAVRFAVFVESTASWVSGSRDKRVCFDCATLSPEQVRQGFIGELKLTPIGCKRPFFLKVIVDGYDAKPAEVAQHLLGKVQEAVTDAVEDTTYIVKTATDKLQRVGKTLKEDIEDLKSDIEEIKSDIEAKIDSDGKNVICTWCLA